MFYTSNYLQQLIRNSKSRTNETNKNEYSVYETIFYGFFSIMFLPFYLFNLIFFSISTYIVPLFGIIFMLFVGFPMLKLLQYLYYFTLFSRSMFSKYLVHWKNLRLQKMNAVYVIEFKPERKLKQIGDSSALEENSLQVLEK